MAKYTYIYNGYTVGDRLLEDAMFAVEMDVTGNAYALGKISPAASSASYLQNIKWRNFEQAMRNDIEGKLTHLAKCVARDGVTVAEYFEDHEPEAGGPGAQCLDEI